MKRLLVFFFVFFSIGKSQVEMPGILPTVVDSPAATLGTFDHLRYPSLGGGRIMV